MESIRSRQHLPTRFLTLLIVCSAFLLLAACRDADDGANDTVVDPGPTPTEVATAATPEPDPITTPEPDATAPPEATDDAEGTAEPTPAPDPSSTPEPEPAEDVDLAPELAGLTDWRNSNPVTLKDLRGAPVVLVFWNSI